MSCLQPECWICRDVSRPEPLVRPCRCRGSMDGVHASCVEAWAKHQRQLLGAEPRCSVCCTPYVGTDREPGFAALIRHMFVRLAGQLFMIVTEGLRYAVVGLMIVRYSEITGHGETGQEESCSSGGPTAVFLRPFNMLKQRFQATPLKDNVIKLHEAFFVGLFLLFLLYKSAILLVSMSSRPPRRCIARYFYCHDVWALARNGAELMATALLLGWQCLTGCVGVLAFLPCLIAVLAPVLKWLSCMPRSNLMLVVRFFIEPIIVMPLEICMELKRLLVAQHRRLLNPLDGSIHALAGLIAVVLCLSFPSREPAFAFFIFHSFLLVCGILERSVVQRFHWQDGQGWWCATLISLDVLNIVFDRRWFTLMILLIALRALQRATETRLQPDFFDNSSLWWCTLLVLVEVTSMLLREVRGAPERTLHTQVSAAIWFVLICSMSVTVNWNKCKRYYRTWQRRNAHFVLCVPPQNRGHDAGALVP
mmetsp:Transcript_41249/g.94909  ORF Transcript_41249/g.94909 Transcript_41249/m.94909 type:complete len:478 (-) Transcript_41249:24-1457(-)